VTADVLTRDRAFRQWLAARPGLWPEAGVFDDASQIVALMAERRGLGLPPIAALGTPRSPCLWRHTTGVPARLAADSDMIGGHP
jgi:hypothetical protein